MAKLIKLTDEQLTEDLRKKMLVCEDIRQRLKTEFDLANEIYQGVQTGYKQGAIDAALLSQAIARTPKSDEEIKLDTTSVIQATLFLHAKLSITDPVITTRPYNADIQNKKAAEYAQLVAEHIKEVTHLSEELQKGPYLSTCVKGNGILFVGWDEDAGEVEANGAPDPDNNKFTIEMTGDYLIRNVPPERFWIDPSATILEKNANYVFELEFKDFNALASCEEVTAERLALAKEEMNSEESLNLIKEHVNDKITAETNTLVPLFHYWEPQRVWNGMNGTHAVFMCQKEPKLIYTESNPYEHGELPYAMLTDIDIPDSIWGMSRILFALPLMEAMSQLFTQVIVNIELHGNIRLLLPEGSLNDESRTQNPYKTLFYNAATGGEPKQMTPTHVTTDIWRFEEIVRAEISRLYGMGEFSQGEIKRELSSYAVQIAIEMDDKFRVRLFNKKKEFIRRIYELLLAVTKQYVKTKRALKIVGSSMISDKSFFDAADLTGEYGFNTDYGMYLPVDPAARKQQILELIKSNVLQDAGVDMKKVIATLVSGDIISINNYLESHKKVQDKETYEIINGSTIPIQPWHDSEAHLESLADFMGTIFFESLPFESKQRLNEHKTLHVEALAKLKAEAQNTENPEEGGQGGAPAGGGEEGPGEPGQALQNMTSAPMPI